MLFESILFGIVQGILEWLPISSKGNLVLLMVGGFSFSPQAALSLAVFLHIGTLLSVLVYFRKDVVEIVKSLKTYRPNFSMENSLVSFLIVASIVTGVVGYPLFAYVYNLSLDSELFLALVGVFLVFTGLIQKFVGRGGGKKKLNLVDSIILGVFQGFSAIPGLSRSGMTVSAFLFRNYNAKDALRYSFLLSIPAVLGMEIGLAILNYVPVISLEEGIAGLSAAFIAGILSIHALLGIAKKVKFWIFCIFLGLVAIAPLLLIA